MPIFKKKDNKKTEQEKVEERREEVLAAGRKFKYPLQWTRYRVVVNTILIAVVILSVLAVGGWLALYKLGMTDEFLFRITKMVPMSVATVEDENVKFSDYLMLYRSSILSMERQTGSQLEGGPLAELQAEYKRAALTDAEKYTYAIKLAKEYEVNVTDEQVQSEFDRHLNIGGTDRSEEGFIKIIQDNFGLDKSEYERMLYLSLIKAEVEMRLDDNANKIVEQVESLLTANDDYKAVAEKLGDKIVYEETGGLIDNKNIDGGRSNEAMKLEPGKSSGRFVSTNGDGYYFVKLIKKTDTEVNFVSIKVPFTEFDKRFSALEEENKIKEYIEIKNPSEEEGY